MKKRFFWMSQYYRTRCSKSILSVDYNYIIQYNTVLLCTGTGTIHLVHYIVGHCNYHYYQEYCRMEH